MVGEASSPRCLERLRGLRARWCLRGLEWVLGRSPGRHLGAFWSPGRALRDLWEALGRLLGASWEPLGASWRLLGASCRLLGASWGTSGSHLADLGSCWTHLGASWSALGASWEGLGRLLGASWERLGSILEVIWCVWKLFWRYFGAWEAYLKRFVEILKTMKNHVRYCKNRGSEDKKSLEIRAKINLESVFKAKNC